MDKTSRLLLAAEFLDIRVQANEETPSPTLERLRRAQERVQEILLAEMLRAQKKN